MVIGISFKDDPVVGPHDLLDPLRQEVVERVQVLLHQAPHLEERGEESELVDGGLDRRGKRLIGRVLLPFLLLRRAVVTGVRLRRAVVAGGEGVHGRDVEFIGHGLKQGFRERTGFSDVRKQKKNIK